MPWITTKKEERSQKPSTSYINDFIFPKKRPRSSYCSSTHFHPKYLPHAPPLTLGITHWRALDFAKSTGGIPISLTLIKTKGPIFMLTWYCPPAVPSDHITALTGDPKEIISIRQLEEPDKHPYEWLDKMLNSICSEYAKWNGIMPSAMRQGPMGLPGLCNTLQYIIEKGFASDEILEMCINNLIEEAKKVYITIYIPRKTQHSWCVTFSDLE